MHQTEPLCLPGTLAEDLPRKSSSPNTPFFGNVCCVTTHKAKNLQGDLNVLRVVKKNHPEKNGRARTAVGVG